MSAGNQAPLLPHKLQGIVVNNCLFGYNDVYTNELVDTGLEDSIPSLNRRGPDELLDIGPSNIN